MKKYFWKLNKIYSNETFDSLIKELSNIKISNQNIKEYNRLILKYFTFCNMQLMICENSKMYLNYKNKLIDIYNKVNNIKKESESKKNYNYNENYFCNYRNKKIKFNDSTFSLMMNNKNREIREIVYKTYLNNIYINKSNLERQLIKNKNNIIMTDNDNKLIKIIVKDLDRTKPLFNKYINIKANILKIKHITFYDLYKSIDNKKYYFNMNDICDSLNLIFNKQQLKEITKNNLLDLYPRKNKRNGYLTISHYDLEPHILINYNNSFKDMLMVCHELGHYIVYKERQKNCTYDELNHFDDLEIPSTVNELLYMYSKLKNKNHIVIISNILDSLLNDFYRYGIYSIFENRICNDIKYKEKDNSFSDVYLKLLKFYYPSIYILEEQKYEYLKLKQLYRKNYCLKYPIAVIISYLIIYKMVTEENYINKYKDFIYSNIDFSYENIKKNLDIDIFSVEVHNFFVEKVNELINELQFLLREEKNDH